MNWLFIAGELLGLGALILIAICLNHPHAYGTVRTVVTDHAHHSLREALNLWGAFIGILLIAVLCSLLTSSILGEGWPASCLALAIFFIIGLNLLDDEFGG
jgi:hypothetical protein